MDKSLEEAIRLGLVDDKLLCPVAFDLASRSGLAPLAIGQAADAMGVRVSSCQLGLFGYGDKAQGRHRIVRPFLPIPANLESALRAVERNGRVNCADVWRIAADLGLPRLTASGGAEALGLKVSHCQLGCF